jgi:uncharacterized protein DUF6916
MEASLTHEEFSQQINTQFLVRLDETNTEQLELTEVSPLKLYPRQEEFSVLFRGPLNTFLGQGVRPFSHEQLGEFELFIVPIRQDDKGFYYEAIFNRIRETT